MDPMPKGCRNRVRLYASNGLMINEIIDAITIIKGDAYVKIVTGENWIVTLYGTITVEEVP